ncbi:MAG: hypothetical protein LBQ67_02520 [Treponema sp.]|jgi:hypothetical protein|nr:hypothetical protein [Treponema sp.]
MHGDYIPRPDAEFNNWFKHLSQYVTQKTSGATPAWTHIPPAEVILLNNSYAGWYTAYAMVLKPHTPAETLACPKAFGYPATPDSRAPQQKAPAPGNPAAYHRAGTHRQYGGPPATPGGLPG